MRKERNSQPCGGKHCTHCKRCKILERLDARLSAMKPEQFIAPPLECQKGDVVIGQANDDIKRLVTLEQLLFAKKEKLLQELSGRTSGLRHRRILKEKCRIAEMSYAFICEIVELELNNPDIVVDNDKQFVSVRKDWCICGYDNKSDIVG